MIVDHFTIRLGQLMKDYRESCRPAIDDIDFSGFMSWLEQQTKPITKLVTNGAMNGTSRNNGTIEGGLPG